MKHCLAIAFVLCPALFAAQGPKLLPIDRSIAGVTMTGPDDPGFQALSAALLTPDKMAAGEQRIVFRSGSIESLVRSGKPPRTSPAATISVSIDLVIYANWLAAGPDDHQRLKRLLSSMRAGEDVCKQLGSGAPGAETLALLQKEAAAAVSPPRDSTDWCAWDFQRMAERLLSSLHAGDPDSDHRICAPVLAASGIPALLHRPANSN